MAKKNVRIEQLGGVYRRDFEEAVAASERALLRAALRGVPIVAEATPSDRGLARAGWKAVPAPGGANLQNDAPHIGILEGGSRPHRPPLEPILRWVVRTFGLNLDGGRRSFEDIDDVPSETKGVAWAVADKIAEEATAAHWMVRDNLDKLTKIAREEVERALGGI